MDYRRLFSLVLAGLVAAVLSAAPRAQQPPVAAADEPVSLTVYTTLDPDRLEPYAKRFSRDNPGIRIDWVRESTGVLTERLLAERYAPQADVIWGLAATHVLRLKAEGMLDAYEPVGLLNLYSRFRDVDHPPYWVGMNAWVAVLCLNTVELKFAKVEPPQSWKALILPEYKGRIAMPSPVYSGTGFIAVAGWLELYGEEEGWKFMDRLHENVSHYTRSGSRPCTQASRGEVAIGIASAARAAQLRGEGAPMKVALPSEGISWGIGTTAIIKGTPRLGAARKLVDWSISEEANRMYNERYAVIGIPGLAKPVEYFPEDLNESLIDMDFERLAVERLRIIAEWQSRYAAKTEPEAKKKQ